MNWHAKKEEQLLKQLDSSKKGISEQEARKRLKQYGKNQLRKLRRLNALKIFLSQFTSFLVILLIIAAVILWILGEWLDFAAIMGIVVLNAIVGFFQEYKAERAIEKLRNMLVPKTKILRNGKVEEIDAREIVPGDILVLTEGDKIMADARILESENLQTNEAALTGESVPQGKQIGILKIDTPLGDRSNMLFQGTEVVKGNCQALVVNTGMQTEFGKIAEMVQKVKQDKNPLRKRLDDFARKIGFIAIGLIVFITVLGFIFGLEKIKIFMTAVSLAVSAVPSGLPVVITICLALATQRMLKVKSLIRKLPAAETLGRANFICTDKTGTITEEKMEVRKIYIKNIMDNFQKNKDTELLFRIGVLCNNARIEYSKKGGTEYLIGDPTEKALILAAKKYGLDKKAETEKSPRVKEFPFSSERKMMSIVRKAKSGYVSYVKGAPEVIVRKCNSESVNGKIKQIDDKRKKQIIKDYEKMAAQGLRVLGFAYKTIVSRTEKITQDKAEKNLIFVGFQGMIDPPRKEVKEAVEQCKNAGIKVVMITGDSALTAKAVGEEIGLKGRVVEAPEFSRMSDGKLSKEIYEISIFARVSPEDKLRIVEILKKNKEIVAVTGDGVNDAPALKKADIGIAVGRGTDVAKDSSDIILLDNNFASIVKAVKEGRRVYDNLKKFIKYMLSANFDEVMVIMIAIFMGFPLPLLPLQILWLNFVSDSLPALSLSTVRAEEDVMRRKPAKESILKGITKFIILAGLLAFIITFLIFYLHMQDIDKARTMALTTALMFEMFLVFNCKNKDFVWKSPINKYMVLAVIASIILHLVVVYTPVNIFFKFVPLSLLEWGKIVGLCAVCFIVIEATKIRKLKERK